LELARYLVDAVVLEGRSYREAARAHGVCKSRVAQLVARYRADGSDALAPRSKGAAVVANKSSPELEERVVRLRKEPSRLTCDASSVYSAGRKLCHSGRSSQFARFWPKQKYVLRQVTG
jgi:transposase